MTVPLVQKKGDREPSPVSIWLSELSQQDEDDSVDEVIRYTLDELRFA